MEQPTPRDVLDLWESTWGPLDDKWKEAFLAHVCMEQILRFTYGQIDFCIRKTRKLERLLELLQQSSASRVHLQSSSTGGIRHVSEYGRLTIRSPGKAEEVLPGRSECPSCGMMVTGNNSKCRCG